MIVTFEYHNGDCWVLLTALNDPDTNQFLEAFDKAATMSEDNYEAYKAAVTLFDEGFKMGEDIFDDITEAIKWWSK